VPSDDGNVVLMDPRCYSHGMMAPARRHATYADLVAVPEHLVAEIIDGELYTSPRSAPRHAAAASTLVSLLHAPFDLGRTGPGGGRIIFEPELHLGADVLVPDIAAWRRERLPRLPDEAYFLDRPRLDLRSSISLDRCPGPWKEAACVREGSGEARVDARPSCRNAGSASVGIRALTIVATHLEREVAHAEPFQSLGLELTLLWDEPQPNTPRA
jgi:hypothetical protein